MKTRGPRATAPDQGLTGDDPRAAPPAGCVDYREFLQLVGSDLHRHAGTSDCGAFLRFMASEPGFRYSFWLRLVAWLRVEPSGLRLLLPMAGLIKRHLSYKYGISIPARTQIGPGLFISHFGGIVVNEGCIVGSNCNISHGVTLGQVNRGPHRGVPTIGDNVYIGPGAMIIGKLTVGADVAVGANAVVTKDVPEGAVVGGVPAEVISYGGSAGYCSRLTTTGTDEPAREEGGRG